MGSDWGGTSVWDEASEAIHHMHVLRLANMSEPTTLS